MGLMNTAGMIANEFCALDVTSGVAAQLLDQSTGRCRRCGSRDATRAAVLIEDQRMAEAGWITPNMGHAFCDECDDHHYAIQSMYRWSR